MHSNQDLISLLEIPSNNFFSVKDSQIIMKTDSCCFVTAILSYKISSTIDTITIGKFLLSYHILVAYS